MKYTIRACYNHGQGWPPGGHPEWNFVWYETEQDAEEAARGILKRTKADRVEILYGQETVVRALHRPA
jgi:hypothetical protein